MTVQELIDNLQKIKDKGQEVYYHNDNWDDEHRCLEPLNIVETNSHQYISGQLTGIVIW